MIKVYVVFQYDSIHDGEEIESIWTHKENAEKRLKAVRGFRVEEHNLNDLVIREDKP